MMWFPFQILKIYNIQNKMHCFNSYKLKTIKPYLHLNLNLITRYTIMLLLIELILLYLTQDDSSSDSAILIMQ